MNLEPLHDGIIFQFEDETTKGQFRDKSNFGLILGFDSNRNTQDPRWVKVAAVGPDVSDEAIVVGARVLIEPLMWTEGFKHNGQEYWKTDESKILLIEEK